MYAGFIRWYISKMKYQYVLLSRKMTALNFVDVCFLFFLFFSFWQMKDYHLKHLWLILSTSGSTMYNINTLGHGHSPKSKSERTSNVRWYFSPLHKCLQTKRTMQKFLGTNAVTHCVIVIIYHWQRIQQSILHSNNKCTITCISHAHSNQTRLISLKLLFQLQAIIAYLSGIIYMYCVC